MRARLSVLMILPMLVIMVPDVVHGANHALWLLRSVAAEMLSADEAAHRAKQQYGGRVLSVRLEQPQGQSPFYRVKLISDGNVRVVEIPAGN